MTVQQVYERALHLRQQAFKAVSDALGLLPSSGSDSFTMPVVVSGSGEVTYINETGFSKTVSGAFYFTADLHAGDTIFQCEGVRFYVTDDKDFTGSPTASKVTYYTNNSQYVYTLSPSNVFDRWIDVEGGVHQAVTSFSARRTDNSLPVFRYASNTVTPFFRLAGSADVSNVPGDTSAGAVLPSGGDTVDMDGILQDIVDQLNSENPDSTININDVPTYDDWLQEQEGTTDPTEPIIDSNGNITVNNYDTINADIDISGDADIDVNGSVNFENGAFGAGAFGAGAFGAVDVGGVDLNLSGNLEVSELNLNGNAITYQISGDAYIIDGDSVQFPTYPPIEFPSYPAIEYQPFSIDYDEILSERELETILSQGEYNLRALPTDNFLSLEVSAPAPQALPAEVSTSIKAVSSGSFSLFDSLGLTAVFLPLSIVSIVVFLVGGRK